MKFETLGPYRIGRRLGRGGMGTVYAAEAIDTGMPAAVKVLASGLASETGFRDRFKAEIETLRKLRHPNIVRLYGFGETEGVLFYAMELVEGTSLEEEIQSGRRFSWKEVLPIAIKISRALRHAHDSGVIHRDIKPANLLLGQEGEVKLSDFGIAKLFGNTGMTADGGVIGTAEYMAPEQADGRPVTHRCDLYSLGSVLYALCAGRPPFRARSLPEMLHMQRFAEPERLRTFAPEAPVELEQLISELLVKEPDKRIPTALVLARRLEAMEHGLLRRELRSKLSQADARDETGEFDFDLPQAPPSAAPGLTEVAQTKGDRDDELDYEVRHDDDMQPTRSAPPAHNALTSDTPSTPSGAKTEEATVQLIGPSASSEAARAAPSEAESDVIESPPGARFTRVEELEEEGPAHRAPWIAAQTAVLAVALVGLGFGAWYFLRPAPADSLYQRIMKVASSDQKEGWLDAEPQIQEFLARYPSDGRADELRQLQSEIDLYRLERRFQRRLRSRNKEEALSPLERAYVRAIQAADRDPEQGMEKLRGLLALYGNDKQLAKSDEQCVELARRQLERIEAQVEAATRADLAELNRQLERAESLQATDPAKAESIWRGIVELYADRPWANAAVQTARHSLSGVAKAGGS